MHRNKYIFLFLCIGILFSSCVKSYQPDINSNETNNYVVLGQLTNQEGFQEVSISKAASVGAPKVLPVKNCTVYILDDKGNTYMMNEYSSGIYHVYMSQSDLQAGTSYQLDIITKDGTEIISSFDKMPEVPDVDSVYFLRKDIPTNNPGYPTKGIQFYIDYNGSSSGSPYVKWDLEETWEYHTEYPIEAYYDGSTHYLTPYDYTRHICWKTTVVDDIFTLSTQNLGGNKYKMFPLHFVDNHSSRLAYGYSLLIKQLSLSQAAYIYWDKVRINHNSNGGLYQQQPLTIKGNLVNKTRPNEEVLGYFNASSVKTKRIFVQNVAGLDMDFSNFCGGPMKLEIGWQEGGTPEHPIYLVVVDNSYMWVDEFCVDCLLQKGINVKPNFWPN